MKSIRKREMDKTLSRVILKGAVKISMHYMVLILLACLEGSGLPSIMTVLNMMLFNKRLGGVDLVHTSDHQKNMQNLLRVCGKMLPRLLVEEVNFKMNNLM